MEDAIWLNSVAAKVFLTTRWTVIETCRDADETRAREALAELCQAYWQPIYICIRHQGHSIHDAQDLTQDFFLQLVKGTLLERLDAAKGRFRAYLSAALRNFLRDRHRRRWTLRRGRDYQTVSFDAQDAESNYQHFPITEVNPEYLFERQWAKAVVDHTLGQLRIEISASGKEIIFEHFNSILTGDDQQFLYPEIAKSLGLTVGGLRATLFRWRQRYRALMRAEIARTVVSSSEIDDELRHLHRVFARGE